MAVSIVASGTQFVSRLVNVSRRIYGVRPGDGLLEIPTAQIQGNIQQLLHTMIFRLIWAGDLGGRPEELEGYEGYDVLSAATGGHSIFRIRESRIRLGDARNLVGFLWNQAPAEGGVIGPRPLITGAGGTSCFVQLLAVTGEYNILGGHIGGQPNYIHRQMFVSESVIRGVPTHPFFEVSALATLKTLIYDTYINAGRRGPLEIYFHNPVYYRPAANQDIKASEVFSLACLLKTLKDWKAMSSDRYHGSILPCEDARYHRVLLGGEDAGTRGENKIKIGFIHIGQGPEHIPDQIYQDHFHQLLTTLFDNFIYPSGFIWVTFVCFGHRFRDIRSKSDELAGHFSNSFRGWYRDHLGGNIALATNVDIIELNTGRVLNHGLGGYYALFISVDCYIPNGHEYDFLGNRARELREFAHNQGITGINLWNNAAPTIQAIFQTRFPQIENWLTDYLG